MKKSRLGKIFKTDLTRRAAMMAAVAVIAFTGPAQAFFFSGGTPIGGGTGGVTLTTMTLTSKAGGNIAANQPFQFGLPIAPATMATTDKIILTDASSNLLTVQEDNRVVDADGFVRWIMVTSLLGTAPGAASTTITVGKIGGTPNTSNPITLANLLAQTISADTFECQNEITMPDGTLYTAKATDGLNASTSWTYGSAWNEGIWRQGPFCTEFVVYAPYVNAGTPHPYLYCEFHIAAYKASGSAWNNVTNPITGVKVYCLNENGFNGTIAGWAGTPSDYAYDWAIKMGASALSTALALTGGAGVGTLTLGATSGNTTVTRSSGTWAVDTTTPNSSDNGKALYQISTGKIGYINGFTSATNVNLTIPIAWTGTSIIAADWKQVGVYHYFSSRVTNTNPAIGGSWWGTNHDNVYPILTVAYLKASAMLPNLRLTSASCAAVNLTLVNRDGAHPCGMSRANGAIKNYGTTESATGDADHIGVLPYNQASGFLWWENDHANARKLVMYNAEVGHKKPYWWRNEEYGQINTQADSGIYVFSQGTSDAKGIAINNYTAGNNWFAFAENHSGQTNYFQYVVTGDLYQLQNMFMMAVFYPEFATGYYIYDQTKTFTISGATLTTTANPTPFLSNEAVQIRSTGALPQVSGVTISQKNRYFFKALSANTGNLYDTLAHCQAGGATGKITFSSTGSGLYFNNGYTKGSQATGNPQTRTQAWCARSAIMPVCVWPDNPITPGLIGYDTIKPNTQRKLASLMVQFDTLYASNGNYQAGGPRFLTPQNGQNSGIWQQFYYRMTLNLGAEACAQPSASGKLQSNLDWFLADAIQWHIEPTIFPPVMSSSYYVQIQPNTNSVASGATNYTYLGIYNAQIGTPFAIGRGGVAYCYVRPTNVTATISSVATPSAVVVDLSGNWFDLANKALFEGIAWFGLVTASTGQPPTYTGFGQIVTVNSPTQVVVDFTATSGYGLTISPLLPSTGSGKPVMLPWPSAAVASSVIAAADYSFNPAANPGTATATVGSYAIMDRSAIELSKQRGINVGAANVNYTAAVAEMTNRNFPTTWSGATDIAVKFNLLSRI